MRTSNLSRSVLVLSTLGVLVAEGVHDQYTAQRQAKQGEAQTVERAQAHMDTAEVVLNDEHGAS